MMLSASVALLALFSCAVDSDMDGVPASADCDDGDPSVYRWVDAYEDKDGDGFSCGTTVGGESPCSDPVQMCVGRELQAEGFTESRVGADCDDDDPSIYRLVDTFLDADRDGYTVGEPENRCIGAVFAVEDRSLVRGGEDCDDEDPSIYQWVDGYIDNDGDGYTPSTTVNEPVCVGQTVSADGYVFEVEDGEDDCDDGNEKVNPAADEVCGDEIDNDCDGLQDDDDEDAVGTEYWYLDDDEDGYGDADHSVERCDDASGDGKYYVRNSDDCDDAAAEVNPAADEVCDEVDNNCDGRIDDDDDDVSDQVAWYADGDGDGYGEADILITVSCVQPPDSAANGTDCDDENPEINPSATEVCDDDGADEDCDGLSDDLDSSVVGRSTWYADGDADGYGDADSSADACTQPSGYVADATDCDDSSATVNPAATEICDDADVDEDCSGDADDADTGVTGTSTWYVDSDGDGHGSATSSTLTLCDPPSGYALDATDCDDSDATTYPSAEEICDEADNDCDGDTDEGVQTTYYIDADGDGYGDPDGLTEDACKTPTGYADDDNDCDDSDADVNGCGSLRVT